MAESKDYGMSEVTQWKDIIEKTVNKDARNFPADQREDLVQDCWLKVLEVQPQIDAVVEEKGGYDARGYVMRVCQNVVNDALRKQPKQVPTTPIDNSVRYEEDKKETTPFGINKAELRDALDHLPPTSRFIVDCLFFRRMTDTQVGAEVRKSRQWVVKEKAKAIVELRVLLKGRNAGTN